MRDLFFDFLAPCLCAFIGCTGFCLVFNIHGAGIFICGAGGALGWLVYLLGGKGMLAGFFAAIAIAIYSETMARIRKSPATGYLVIALLPLVPGGGIYYAMRFCVQGELSLFFSTLMQTISFAAILAIGAMLASSVFRAVFPRFWLRPPSGAQKDKKR